MVPNDLEHLLSLSRRMVETRALQPLLEYAMKEAIQFVGAERGHIVLLNDDGTLDFRVTQGTDPVNLERVEDQVSYSILQNVVESGQPLVVKDAMADPKWKQAKSVLMLRLRSVMCVPLTSRGKAIGAIYVENRSIENRFTESDLAPLVLFANQASVSIENARLYSALEQQVQERTRTLYAEIEERRRIEEALRRSNDELVARNEELDTFAYTVAHDLKNPIGILIGFSDMLTDNRQTISEEEIRNSLDAIRRTAHKINAIVEELLLLSGVRKMQVRTTPLNISEIINESLGRLSSVITETGATLDIPADWPIAVGYAPWIEEVWANYISNACKYGGANPQIRLGAASQDDGMVRFWVEDNGIGLTPEDQSKLFVPFTRLESVPRQGSGLGLSIVRRIVERLGGQVGVESSGQGHGSRFYFTLPGLG